MQLVTPMSTKARPSQNYVCVCVYASDCSQFNVLIVRWRLFQPGRLSIQSV